MKEKEEEREQRGRRGLSVVPPVFLFSGVTHTTLRFLLSFLKNIRENSEVKKMKLSATLLGLVAAGIPQREQVRLQEHGLICMFKLK